MRFRALVVHRNWSPRRPEDDMQSLAAHVWLTTTVTPTPTPTLDPDSVTPGPEGFFVIALIVVAVFLLVADMMRRIRRGRVRADVNEELDTEQARLAAESEETPGGVAGSESSATNPESEPPRG
ncbi:hypothetical protein [Microbacterium sp. NPDC076911]|uniref:hypothetical protein n=1 Tax=Microbacterium sp. NPDC076911 TaxID=3154958 RepID=UPI00341AF450